MVQPSAEAEDDETRRLAIRDGQERRGIDVVDECLEGGPMRIGSRMEIERVQLADELERIREVVAAERSSSTPAGRGTASPPTGRSGLPSVTRPSARSQLDAKAWQ